MTRNSLRFFLPGFLFILCLYYSRPQNKDSVSHNLIITEYKNAERFYDEATALNNSSNYSEEKEMLLNRKALESFQSAFRKMTPSPIYDTLRFFSAFHIGELEHYFEHFREALRSYHEAVTIHSRTSLPDSVLFKPFLYSGIIYYNQNKYDSASFCFHHAEHIQSEYYYSLQESERLYNTFGVLYYEKGDYQQAKNYFLKALEVLPISHPYYKQLFTNYRINLAQIYFKLEDYDESNKIYQELLTENSGNRNEIYLNIGLINLYLGASTKALEDFKKVDYGSSNKKIWLYQNMGEAYFNLEQFDSAKKYFQKAVDAYNYFQPNADHIAYGLTLKSMGELEMRSNHPFAALLNYQQAVRQFYPAYSDTSFTSDPQQFSGVFSYINLFNALVAKAKAFHALYQQSSQLSWAQEELQSYQSAFKLIDYVQRTYNSDEARLFLDKIKYIIHTQPIDIAYELYLKTKDQHYIDVLYVFDQQNKASILALKNQSTEQLLQKDTSLFFKEASIRSEITRLSLKAAQINDSIEFAKINKEIRNHEIELGKIQEQLLTSSVITKIPSLTYLQNQLLDHKTALISFHVSDDKLTTLLITKNKINCDQKELFPEFHQYVTDYISELKTISSTTETKKRSKKIYSFLFGKMDFKNIGRLIIIPDDELNYLSFESLEDSAGAYLIQNCSVQYQYSTSLLKKEAIDFSDHQTLAFAPFVSKEFEDSILKFQKLPSSLNEIDNLQGKKFIDTAATKNNFLNNLSNYKVVHLATHAVASNKESNLSFISFYPSMKENRSEFLLYTEEIYNLPLRKTDLIILSACETASGNLVKGEGVMSLSRAFSYAGCPNIVTSLWNANDFSTAYLTNRFHFYLNKNYTIDAALREAKIDYLNDPSINPRMKNPFYWSHLIFVGNYSVEKSSGHWWMMAIAVAVLIGILVIVKRSRPHKVRPGVNHR